MKIVMLLGKNSSALHGPFDTYNLYNGRALTGSESSFFNIARSLAGLNHEVTLYCDTKSNNDHRPELHGAGLYSIDTPIRGDYDAAISLNEPDLFRELPSYAFNVVCHQFNDFVHATPGFDKFVDAYAFLSPLHADHVAIHTKEITRSKVTWIPNSLIPIETPNRGHGVIRRKPHTAVWCSSPDRGLHRLLELWPHIRKKVPDARLEIYYRIDPWLDRDWENNSKLGVRANYIKECLKRLGRDGENGVEVVGAVSNIAMHEALLGAQVLPYTCECINFTEGFSVSVMDACRAGCVPIISDTDAIGDIYGDVALVIPGKTVVASKDIWVESICRAMLDEGWAVEVRGRAQKFARAFECDTEIGRLWERLLKLNTGEKYRSGSLNSEGMPNSISEFAKWPDSGKIETTLDFPDVVKEPEEPLTLPDWSLKRKAARRLFRSNTIKPISPKMRIAVILGSVSKAVHGVFNADDIYERGQSMTGTGSNFFNLVWGLAERGHTVDAFTDMVEHKTNCEKLGGANLYNREDVVMSDDYEAYISVNEPDILRRCPPGKLRILQMQLNDFSYAQAGFDRFVDYYVCPSDLHARFLADTQGLEREKVMSLPLSINAEFFEGWVGRGYHSMVYCSSPDRGLHHMMTLLPMVRKEVPEASLHIYYQTKPWLDLMLRQGHPDREMKRRAAIIEAGLKKFGEDGQNGLFMHGPVPTKTMAMELKKAGVLVYTCDPICFTEGFSVSVMDACAAGCFPLVAAVDALPDVYTGVVRFMRGKIEDHYEDWTKEIVKAMFDDRYANEVRHTAKAFAMKHTRQNIAKMWETLIRERRKD